MVSDWELVTGLSGDPFVGLLRAVAISCRDAMMRSVEDGMGIMVLVGNQSTVSQVRSA